jgi:hypothetical protein
MLVCVLKCPAAHFFRRPKIPAEMRPLFSAEQAAPVIICEMYASESCRLSTRHFRHGRRYGRRDTACAATCSTLHCYCYFAAKTPRQRCYKTQCLKGCYSFRFSTIGIVVSKLHNNCLQIKKNIFLSGQTCPS